MSKLTREQVKAEAVCFVRKRRCDELTSTWVAKGR